MPVDKQLWAQWITRRYDEWRTGKYGNAASIAEFARLLGASHQVVLSWMEGTLPKSAKYINALVGVYGEGVYGVLGMDIPQREEIPWMRLPPKMRTKLNPAIEEYLNELNSMNLDPESEEAIKLAVEIFSRYGFDVHIDTE